MVSFYTFSHGIPDVQRRDLIFSGAICVFKGIPEVMELAKLAQEITCSVFEEQEPLTAHTRISPSNYAEKVLKTVSTLSHKSECQRAYRSALIACGLDAEQSAWCRTTMRIQPPVGYIKDRNTASLGAHRDTWYSNMYEQNNWWAPIFPVLPGNTLGFYPRYWDRKIANRTKGWDLDEFRTARKEAATRSSDYDALRDAYPNPLPSEPMDYSQRLAIAPEVGDIIVFSSAQMHEGIPNNTDVARFSTDVRTLNIDDTANGIGAPNIDSESTGKAIGDFARMSNGEPLVNTA